MEIIKKFIDCYKDENVQTKFNSGKIYKTDEGFLINSAMVGAEKTFSIGQPVFNENGDMLGYLGITILRNLNYSADDFDEKMIPCEAWKIELPTEHCKHGIEVYTYWQNKVRQDKSLQRTIYINGELKLNGK